MLRGWIERVLSDQALDANPEYTRHQWADPKRSLMLVGESVVFKSIFDIQRARKCVKAHQRGSIATNLRKSQTEDARTRIQHWRMNFKRRNDGGLINPHLASLEAATEAPVRMMSLTFFKISQCPFKNSKRGAAFEQGGNGILFQPNEWHEKDGHLGP